MNLQLNKVSLENILKARFENDIAASLATLYKPEVFDNIELAANRVKKAVLKKQKITIVGDYDVDGVASAAILAIFFEHIGVSVQTILPNRFTDGYGLNPNIAKNLECDLLITVDNGISAVSAAEVCQSKDIELIIIDHHAIPEVLPKAFCIIHPYFSYLAQKQVCAGIVTWYFVAALKKCFDVNFDMRSTIDIAALAAIADVTALNDLNRVIVKAGLSAFGASQRPYALALKKLIGKNDITSMDVAFKLAPRLNSAGRLKDASLAYQFLISKTVDEAEEALSLLDGLNESRKEIEKDVLAKALTFVTPNNLAITVWNEEWNEGVIGIVAARLAQTYEVPAFVISVNGDEAKGSARAPKGYDIFGALKGGADILTKFGGHKLAAGFSLKTKDLPEFKQRMQNLAIKIEQTPTLWLGELEANDIDLELLELIDKYEPYGEGNARPLFLAKNAQTLSVRQVGKSAKYTKLVVALEDKKFEILHKEDEPSFKVGEKLNFAYTLSKNEYNGTISVQMHIEKRY